MKSRIKPMTPGIPHGARMRAYLAGAVLTFAIVGVAARAWGLQVGTPRSTASRSPQNTRRVNSRAAGDVSTSTPYRSRQRDADRSGEPRARSRTSPRLRRIAAPHRVPPMVKI